MSTKERIYKAARSCFAAKGYTGTTIADIEQAAGYSPGSGGLYRHFESKFTILEAVIDTEIAANQAATVTVAPPPADADPVEVLEQVIRRGLAQLDRQADLTRILFADLDQFPTLLTKVRTQLTDATYRDFSNRLSGAHAMGLIPKLDFEATTILAIGSVVDFKVKQHLLGFAPLDVDEDRLVKAWVHMFSKLFEVER